MIFLHKRDFVLVVVNKIGPLVTEIFLTEDDFGIPILSSEIRDDFEYIGEL